MINITIDDKAIQVQPGTSIIDAADANGIYIPRFCYHKKLSIAANCRMCLVEVEGMRKPMPACATDCTDEMKIYTKSKGALEAQRMVMEFLLANHPLDCPICDQGGECELQDLSMGFGRDCSDFTEPKRAVKSDDIGPLIATEMTRCIHCTRCVRFGEEIAGLREMGATFRGDNTHIGTYVKHFLQSELSGNIIDLCPVGALTSKPFRFKSRAWQLKEHACIAPHDCLGSNIYTHVNWQEYAPQRFVQRVLPRENEQVNENWLSDRDRFSYEALQHSDRLQKPQVKRNGTWQEVDWEPILLEVVDKTRAVVSQQGADQLAAIMSYSATTEEGYLMQKLLRSLGSHNIDYRIKEQDHRDQQHQAKAQSLGISATALEQQNAILMLGCYLRHEVPLLNHRVNKAVQNNAKAMCLNAYDYSFNYPIAHKAIVDYATLPQALAEVLVALGKADALTGTAFADVKASDTAMAIASTLKDAENAHIILGQDALMHQDASVLRSLTAMIADAAGCTFGEVSFGANSAGLSLAGCVPHRQAAGRALPEPGLTARQFLGEKPRRVYYVFNTEVEADCAYSADALKALKQAGMVVCFASHASSAMYDYADIILPITPFTETDGTFVNGQGDWQTFTPSSVPHFDAKPGWKVLRVLAGLFELEGFDFKTAQQVRDALEAEIAADAFEVDHQPQLSLQTADAGLTRLASWPMYAIDALSRRAESLQACVPPDVNAVHVSPTLAARLNLTDAALVTVTQADQQLKATLKIDPALAENTIGLHSGLANTFGFGAAALPIEIKAGDK